MRLLPSLLLAAFTGTVTANLDAVSSRLQVSIPADLYRDEGYDHREALFGIPPYGGAISQQVYYSGTNGCEEELDPQKGFPCFLDQTGKCEAFRTPFILMVDRGDCTFVAKVRNAQKFGAAGVLIADNICQCDAATSGKCTNSPGMQCEGFEPIMADDGSGADITVPSFLLFKEDADLIKTRLKLNSVVQIKMSWSIPAPDDRVEWELWSTPTETRDDYFESNFEHEVAAMGESAYFSPHYYIYDGVASQCHGGGACGNLCTNNGLYCAMDPDGQLDMGASGADVVVESLRRLCIWQHYGADDGIGKKWWAYTKAFIGSCNDNDFPTIADTTCADKVMKDAMIDAAVVNQCMSDSGGYEQDRSNTLLAQEVSYKDELGVIIVPAIYVNNVVQRGAVTANGVFNMICNGFLDGTAPSICSACQFSNDLDECVTSGGTSGGNGGSSGGGGGISTGTLVFSLLFTIGIMGAAGFVYYKRTQREMRDQVRGILAEYMPLDDGAGGGGLGAKSGDLSLSNL